MSNETPIGPEERELWKMCDVKLMNRLQSILFAAHRDDRDLTEKLYSELLERYEKIDVSKFDERFPVEVITTVATKIKEMKNLLNNYGKLNDAVQEIASLGMEFRTERYMAYRSMVNETERDG